MIFADTDSLLYYVFLTSAVLKQDRREVFEAAVSFYGWNAFTGLCSFYNARLVIISGNWQLFCVFI